MDYIHDPKQDKSVSKAKTNALNRLERHCLIEQIISTPTCYTTPGSTTLDLIFTNKTDSIITSGVIPYGVSDHELTFCIYNSTIHLFHSSQYEKL